jgi:hypothetical protein
MTLALFRYPARLLAHGVATVALGGASGLAKLLHGCGVPEVPQKRLCWPLVALGCWAAALF